VNTAALPLGPGLLLWTAMKEGLLW
jgi:hypothetical protein